MWIPEYIELDNFMSYIDAVYMFHVGKTVMISGKNNYDSGQKSNGAGKSAIIEAIAMALINQPIKDITLRKMVRRGQKVASLSMSMIRATDQANMIISRKIYSGSTPSSLEITMNGVVVPIESVDAGNKYILSMLGISKEDIMNYFLISKRKYRSFYSSTDGEMKAFINRFSHADALIPIFDIIKKDSGNIDSVIQTIDLEISGLNGKISAYQERIDSGELDVEKEKQQKIDALKHDIKMVNEAIFTLHDLRIKDHERRKEHEDDKKRDTGEINKYNKNIDKLLEDIEFPDYIGDNIKLKSNHIIKIMAEKRVLVDNDKEKKKSLEKVIKDFGTMISEMEVVIAGEIECPKCKFKFLTNKGLDIDEVKLLAADAKLELNSREISLVELEKEIHTKELTYEGYSKKLDELTRISKLISGREYSIAAIDRKIGIVDDSIADIDKQVTEKKITIKGYEKSIKEIEKGKFESELDKVRDSIKECEDYIKTYGDERNVQSGAKELLQELTTMFKLFTGHLASKSLSVIQDRANSVLKKMGSSLSVQINGFSITASGTINDKISTNVLRDGVIVGGIGEFSEGEITRMNIATIISNQSLVNMSAGIDGGIDLLFIDEILESLDSDGIRGTLYAMSNLNRTINVITLANIDDVQFKNNVVAIKDVDGRSKLEYVIL